MTSRAAPTKVISKQLTFCYGIALEQNGETLLILGHKRRLPSSSAPLIEKIGERILVLARMSASV